MALRMAARAVAVALPVCPLLACALVPPAAADEGFFTDDRPPAVAAVWPSVFAFVCEGRRDSYTASAFYVGRQPDKRDASRADYYFVTAGHAITECKKRRRYLVENVEQPRFEADGITIIPRPRRLTGAGPVAVDEIYDIAIVKVAAPARLRIGKPIHVDDKCDRALDHEVFAIGFPSVSKRRSLKLKRETKRWSKGLFVGLGIADFRGSDAVYIASNVDSLPGNSGGPAIDQRGRLVGVVAKGASGTDNAFRYDVDPKKPRDWQTFLVPCDAVLRLMQKSGLE